MNPADWVVQAARKAPGDPALFAGARVLADQAGFAARIAGFAGRLRAAGVGRGDRVVIFAPNAPEWLVALFGIWWAGAAAVPVNAKLHPAEAAWIAADAGARLVLGEGLEGALGWDGLPGADPLPDPEPMAGDDLAWLFYTSGTTGRPKGVMLTAGNLNAMVLSYLADVDSVTAADHALYAAPLSHGAGLYALVHAARGARHVVPESGGFDPAEILHLAAELGRVHMFAAPTMVRRLVAHARAAGARGDGLRTIVYGGGPMYVADLKEALETFGPVFVQIYGQGESPMTITTLSRDDITAGVRHGSVGRAFTGCRVRVADAAGRAVPPGVIGEVLVQGPTVMAGYWNNPAATAATLRGGWLWTGDMGAMDDAGYLTLHDRSKDVIISGGSNIYPREVEEALLTHPAVQEAAVVGRPDPDWGEAVVAFVVAPGADVAALDAHLAGCIARFKRPKDWHLVEALPKNAYGKVLKTELRARIRPTSPPA
jgi:long-chain acyl-CoA synthetase